MEIGKMNTRVSIYKPASGKDSYNQPITDPVLVAKRWAKVEPLNSREYFTSGTERGEVNYQVTFRRDAVTAAIDHTYTLKFGDVSLNIESPLKPANRLEVKVTGRG